MLSVWEGQILGLHCERSERGRVEAAVLEMKLALQYVPAREFMEESKDKPEEQGLFERYKWYILGFTVLMFVQSAMNGQQNNNPA